VLEAAVLISATAAWTDHRSARIPNWLTSSGFLVGVAFHGWWAVLGALFCAGAALVLTKLARNGIGAGDLKLALALGACLAPLVVILSLVSVFLVRMSPRIEVRGGVVAFGAVLLLVVMRCTT
jgi:Flp pilus assembly protein protease CpaA